LTSEPLHLIRSLGKDAYGRLHLGQTLLLNLLNRFSPLPESRLVSLLLPNPEPVFLFVGAGGEGLDEGLLELVVHKIVLKLGGSLEEVGGGVRVSEVVPLLCGE